MLAATLWFPSCFSSPQKFLVRAQESLIQVHVGKSGLFKFLGDSHLIEASLQEGWIRFDPQHPERSRVQMSLRCGELTVKDPGRDPEERRKIQQRMLGKDVLDVEHFPLIRFRSRSIRYLRDGRYRVNGELSLHGKSEPIECRLQVRRDGSDLEAKGEFTVKQTDFGIKPVTAGLGTVRVRNEVGISFRILAVLSP